MLGKIQFHFTSATIVSLIGAALAVAVSFGAHLTRQNTDSILTLVGILAAAVTIGGGAKTAGMIRAGVVGGNGFHFSAATLTAIVGALVAVAAIFGLHTSQENIDALLKLIGLLAGGVVVGGGLKSSAMLAAGTHPLDPKHPTRTGAFFSDSAKAKKKGARRH